MNSCSFRQQICYCDKQAKMSFSHLLWLHRCTLALRNWKQYCNTLEFRLYLSQFQRYKYFRFARPYCYFRLSVVVAIIRGHLLWTRGNRRSYGCSSKRPHHLWLALRALSQTWFLASRGPSAAPRIIRAPAALETTWLLPSLFTADAQSDRCSRLQSSQSSLTLWLMASRGPSAHKTLMTIQMV